MTVPSARVMVDPEAALIVLDVAAVVATSSEEELFQILKNWYGAAPKPWP
jgi:hypothetical protein